MTHPERIPLAACEALAVCAWCFERIPEGVVPVEIAFRKLHAHCADQFDDWIANDPGGWEPAWAKVTDDSLVDFGGQTCRWGDLMLADRKTVDLKPDGRLVGGYRF